MQQQSDQLAAIDLGSNSFHMVVAKADHGEVRVQESLSEKVQLGAGLDSQNRIVDEAQQRALECLGRFAQRIRGIPRSHVRVVGTNTLRMARNAKSFICAAERVLGHDIDVVGGREEARLIYLGVSHFVPEQPGKRLVVDIGGGSTELIIGNGFESIETESLHMGCVSYRMRFFATGSVTARQFDKAVTTARQELLSIEAAYRKMGWNQVVGASGTIKAIAQVCEQAIAIDNGCITRACLLSLRKKIIKAGHVDALNIKGLRDERREIFPSGLAILLAIFQQLDIQSMIVSTGALREGLLYDQLGRFAEEDVRDRSIQALMQRHHVDREQALRVEQQARCFFQQIAADWQLTEEEHEYLLFWSARLHELGLSVSHSQFHKHGAYLVENSDVPGFSRQEQSMLALLVRGHRRKIPLSLLAEQADDEVMLLRLCLILRLSCRLYHARADMPGLDVKLSVDKADPSIITLLFPAGWLDEHPLTLADLEQEQEYFSLTGHQLIIS